MHTVSTYLYLHTFTNHLLVFIESINNLQSLEVFLNLQRVNFIHFNSKIGNFTYFIFKRI